MLGIGHTFSRLPAARLLVAGAAILAGTVTAGDARVAGLNEEVAFASARMPVSGGLDRAALPQPLTPGDAFRLHRIFTLQDSGSLMAAASELTAVSDPLLTGQVLAQRYLGRFAQPSAADLAAWLERYGDQPDAPAIYSLLLGRSGSAAAPPPDMATLPPDPPAGPAPEEEEPSRLQLLRNAALDRFMAKLARAGNADTALHMLARVKGIDPLYGGQLRAEIAQTLFTQGHDEQALHLAQEVQRETAGRVGLAGYVGGLAAWRLERMEQAQPLFESASRASLASTSLHAAAAFWAGRAHLRGGDPAGYRPWMAKAAEARHTFYGLLARRILGMNEDRQAPRDTLGSADGEAVMATPHGRRALALLQAGQPRRAEAELRALWPSVAADAAGSGAVLRVAEAAGLTDLAAQLAGLIELAEGRPHDDARFPLPVLRPAGGFRVDPALVYALTRLESNFEPNAVSGVGARGLMQLMPLTASYMSGDGGSALALNASRLHDPATNLSLGQSYVLYLAQRDWVQGDLVRLLGSYNAGPGGFARMAEAIPKSDDPLLFIESIPNPETRAYVPRALAFAWIYAMQLGLPSPSLDELAAGAWPMFHTPEPRGEQAARAN